VSGAIRELAESAWTGQVPASQLWKPTGRAEEIAPGVVPCDFRHAIAPVTCADHR
jgi:hypothetical protein